MPLPKSSIGAAIDMILYKMSSATAKAPKPEELAMHKLFEDVYNEEFGGRRPLEHLAIFLGVGIAHLGVQISAQMMEDWAKKFFDSDSLPRS